MNLLIPLVSLVGPIYFGVRGSPVVFVLAWAAIWTTLRFLATWKRAYAALQERDTNKPSSWLDRHPYVLMPGVLLVTLMTFEVVHVVIYLMVWRLAGNLN